MSSCISSTSNSITLLILSDTTLVILFLAFLRSRAPHVLSVLYSCTSLWTFTVFFLTFPFFFPHSPFCGATQAHSYCICAAKHQHLQYHKAVRPALPGIKAPDDRRDTLLLPCLSHVPHTFSLSSTMYHISKVIPHRTTKVILLFSFYFPSPSPLCSRCTPVLSCYSCFLAFLR